jgi:hypothetical protein
MIWKNIKIFARSICCIRYENEPVKLNTPILKLLLKLFLIAIIPILVIDGSRRADLAFNPSAKNAYLATFVDKMHLLDSVPSPRLILMSGSSVAFGVDGQLLSNELEIPVVNAALHFQLGSHFLMEQLKRTVRKGDIVLISMEYVMTSKGIQEEQLSVADFYPPAQQWIQYQSTNERVVAYATHRLADFKLMMGELWSGTRRKPISIDDTTSVFFRKCFAKNGDLLGHLNNPSPGFNNPEISDEIVYDKQIQDFNDFYDFATQKGVSVLFTFPTYAESGFEKNMPVIRKLEKQLRDNLKIPIIGNPENSVMDDSFFFDSVYHPNAKGRKIFTSRLIQLLEQEGI